MRIKNLFCAFAFVVILGAPVTVANAAGNSELSSFLSVLQQMVANLRGQIQSLSNMNVAQVIGSTQATTTYSMLTGVHWAEPAEYLMLKEKGLDFVITTVQPTDTARINLILDTAASTGMKVVIGAYPLPYTMVNGQWNISAEGVSFLKYLQSKPTSIMALFVFNEPYWINPTTNLTSECGAVSAAELRALRTKIKEVWPEAKIYHDIGAPGWWAPGGDGWKSYPCMADRYKDATNVADYVGIWDYPFKTDGSYTKTASLEHLKAEVNYVKNSMAPALPVLLGQSSAAPTTDLLRFPTQAELQDWNCALRTIPATGLSWYVWKQDLYPDYLQKHPEYLPSVVRNACAAPTAPTSPGNTAPQLGSVIPVSGSGASQTFTFMYTDADGAADLNHAHAIFGSSASGFNNCMLLFDFSRNAISLNTNDMSGAWPTASVGTAATLANSQCKVNSLSTSYFKSGTVVTVTVPVEFTTAFTGTKNVYMRAADNAGSVADYGLKGTWNITSSTPTPPAPTPVPTYKFVIGDRVWITTNNVNVRSAPGLSAKVLGKHKSGVSGYVLGGPQYADGYTWWQVDFSKNPDGWVAENYLTK